MATATLRVATNAPQVTTPAAAWNSPSVGEWVDLVTWWKVG
jgi:hypothetical protein